MTITKSVYESLVSETGEEALVLAILHSMREESMVELLRSCVEMNPQHHEGLTALIKGLQAGDASPEHDEIDWTDAVPKAVAS